MSETRARDLANVGVDATQLATDAELAAIPMGSRNLLYNGAMQVAQRGTSTAGITSDGYYTADRWNTVATTQGTWTQSVESDGPTGSGLSKSLKMLCTTADAAPAAGDFLRVQQLLEGQDVQRIAKGTASAQKLSMSFWVKSNVTGTYIASLFDLDNTRTVSASYTISASATWEKKTIVFPADVTGVFSNNNATSLYAQFWLGAGSDRSSGTLSTVWDSLTLANAAVGQTNLAAATNNYWQVTGVQLEVGDTATEFEFKSFGQELRECYRYFYRLGGVTDGYPLITSYTSAAGSIDHAIAYPVTMRAAPTITKNGTWTGANFATQPSSRWISSQGFSITWTATNLGATQIYPDSTDDYFDISAEL